jgi:hypothetical protein
MTKFLTIDLENQVPDVGPVKFLWADLSAKRTPFAVVHYSYDGTPQDFGLRLDLDKLVFLDRPDDIDPESADGAAKKIASIVADAKKLPA